MQTQQSKILKTDISYKPNLGVMRFVMFNSHSILCRSLTFIQRRLAFVNCLVCLDCCSVIERCCSVSEPITSFSEDEWSDYRRLFLQDCISVSAYCLPCIVQAQEFVFQGCMISGSYHLVTIISVFINCECLLLPILHCRLLLQPSNTTL